MSIQGLALAAVAAFAAGAVLLLLLTLLPASRSTARQLWPLLASEAVILAAGILPWLMPRPALLALLVLAALRIGYESGTVHGKSAGRPLAAPFALVMAAAAVGGWLAGGAVLLVAGVALLALAVGLIFATDAASPGASLARFLVFPVLPFMAFSHAAGAEGLAVLLVLAFLLVEVFDSFSLLGGRLFGRRPMAPRLSPRKSWEGFATGAAALVLAAAGLALWAGIPASAMTLAVLAILAAAPVGDLLGSAAKRRAGVKDYPPVMAVQGGLLDIADSWVLAGPVLAFLLGR